MKKKLSYTEKCMRSEMDRESEIAYAEKCMRLERKMQRAREKKLKRIPIGMPRLFDRDKDKDSYGIEDNDADDDDAG